MGLIDLRPKEARTCVGRRQRRPEHAGHRSLVLAVTPKRQVILSLCWRRWCVCVCVFSAWLAGCERDHPPLSDRVPCRRVCGQNVDGHIVQPLDRCPQRHAGIREECVCVCVWQLQRRWLAELMCRARVRLQHAMKRARALRSGLTPISSGSSIDRSRRRRHMWRRKVWLVVGRESTTGGEIGRRWRSSSSTTVARRISSPRRGRRSAPCPTSLCRLPPARSRGSWMRRHGPHPAQGARREARQKRAGGRGCCDPRLDVHRRALQRACIHEGRGPTWETEVRS